MKGLFSRGKKNNSGSSSPLSTSPSSPQPMSPLRKTNSSGSFRNTNNNNDNDEEALFVANSAMDNSRFFANNSDLDYNQAVESYGDLIHPKELQEDKPSCNPLRNRVLLLTNNSNNSEDSFPDIKLRPDEQEWLHNMSKIMKKQGHDESEKKNIRIGLDDVVDKEGWMTKEGRIVKSWKKRWFVLSGNTLGYYTAKKNKLKGSISLDGAKIELAMNRTDHQGCLSLYAKELSGEETEATDSKEARTLYFDAENEKERHEWFVAINNKIAFLNYQRRLQRKGFKTDQKVVQFFELGSTNGGATTLELLPAATNEQQQQLIDITVCALKEPIRFHKTLVTLSFKNLQMGDTVFKYICSALTENASVKSLNMTGNNLSEKAMQEMSSVLKKNNTLENVVLAHNILDDQAVTVVCESLATNSQSKISFIDLSYNKIGDAGAEQISTLLTNKKNQFKWDTLQLSHNNIGDEGASKIADLLLKNDGSPNLVHLELGYNKIKNDGAIAISNALKLNKTTKLLNLEYNKIEYDGIKNLAFMIVENTTMDTIVLGGNKLGEQAFSLLANTDMNFPELELSTKLSVDQEDEN
jgi:hypothetical protein